MKAGVLILAGCLVSIPPAAAQADKEVVKVNGTPIRQSEVMNRLWKRYGTETLEEMVDELLLRQDAQAKKVKAAPDEVNKRLERVRAQFPDPKILENQLEQAGSSMDKLKEDIGDQLVREKLIISRRRLSVKEGDLKKAFAEHRQQLGTPPGVHLRHILVKTESEAKDLLGKIKGGADFIHLAREKFPAPTGKINGGDYGMVSKGMLPPEIEEVAFAMKLNEVRMLPSPNGFHILQTLEKRAAAPAEYEKVKKDLREMLLQQKIKQALPEYVQELRRKAEIQP
ncbi:MAG: hypothetical protein A3J74_07325 [Elusimicrobia bacterium RIFCSPHIGHO2_02_FULL_57_9]|nr:MAG: hypothetical protein A3J74_07325 [Elusimicrobia bacterium RIFCSPHIGHO2_02_FULL_57_9]